MNAGDYGQNGRFAMTVSAMIFMRAVRMRAVHMEVRTPGMRCSVTQFHSKMRVDRRQTLSGQNHHD